MATVAPDAVLTPDDFLVLPRSKGFELVDGNLQELHMGALSGWIGGRLFSLLNAYCERQKYGWVFPCETGYQCFRDMPNTVRKPDVSVVRFGRLPGEQIPVGWIRIAPDFVAEVVSPNDLVAELEAKVFEYQTAGVSLIWIINPETRTVRIHRIDGSIDGLREHDTLDGEDVVPGFRCPVRDLFPPVKADQTT